MTHQSPQADFAPPPSASIAVLRCHETFTLDPVPLVALFDEMSESDAEAIICRALEDIAHRLDSVQDCRASGQFVKVPKTVRRISAVARQIGLTSISIAADHVATAATLQSGVALGATLARLERAFDAAVSEVWSFRQHIKQ